MPNVIGLFENFSEAQGAVERLSNAAFNRDRISLLGRDADHEQIRQATNEPTNRVSKGAGVGAVLGGAGALIAGMAGLMIPGIGALIAAGPIATALTSALGGAGLGAAAGGVIGALTKMGVPEKDASLYENHLRQGMALVAVQADSDDDADRAADIMELQGAVDVEGRTRGGNAEAAPEYEGNRAGESKERVARSDNRTAADVMPADQPIADFSRAPSSVNRQDAGPATASGRVRVYNRVGRERTEATGPVPDEFDRR
jgi:hypothetical protein